MLKWFFLGGKGVARKQQIIGVSLGVLISMSVAGAHPVWADSSAQLQNQINLVHKKKAAKLAQVKQDQKSLNAVQQQKDQAVQEITQLISQITNTQNQISQKQSEVQHTKNKIDRLKQEIAATQKQIKIRDQLLKKRVRYMYENGSTVNIVQVLLGSQNFSDLIDRVIALNLINKQDKQLLDQQLADMEKLKLDQAEVKKEYNGLQNQLDSLKNLQSQYNQKEQKQQALVNQLKMKVMQAQNHISNEHSSIKAFQSKISSLINQRNAAQKREEMAAAEKAAAQKAAAQRAAAQKAAAQKAATQKAATQKTVVQQAQTTSYVSHVSTVNQLNSVNVNNMLTYADQFIGLPYVWGGTTPNPGFDCSGFTQYVFGHFGISLPRTAEEQFNGGVPVNKANLKPGDLVFFSTYAPGASHVGIYMGGGDMIDSEDFGLVIDNMNNQYWSSRYIGARRYIN